jgi:hypothetical protein
MWKEMVITYVMYYTNICLEKLKKAMKKLSQLVSRLRFKHEAGVPTTQPWHSVFDSSS